MRSPLTQQLLAGAVGAVIGLLVEGALNRALGATVISDGALWGALVAVAVASLPNLRGMGAKLLKDGAPWQQLVVGIVAFLVISVGIILTFLLTVWLYSRLVG
jgi:hypothetical protein